MKDARRGLVPGNTKASTPTQPLPSMRRASTVEVSSSPNTRSSPKRPTAPKVQPAKTWPETGKIEIASNGDLVLDLEHAQSDVIKESGLPLRCSYRVQSSLLKKASPYFQNLLDPSKFAEGAVVAEKHETLREAYGTMDAVPSEALPKVLIEDVGRISHVKNIRLLMADFFSILHAGELTVMPPPLANIANLVIVADRFDALPTMRQFFKSRKLMHMLDSKTQDRTMKGAPEERVRQKLLVGLLLDNPSWVWNSSLRLIQRGWVGREIAEGTPLWWDMPMGIEDELLCRREYILDTIQSLQSHFLGIYTSRDRQCKLGYDSSAECDSYQLGQMVRFFKRVGTLSLAGTLLPPAEDELPLDSFDGEIANLVEQLRQCPEYQIDKNHSHCGLRTRLMPLLDLIELSLSEVGICTHCWQECRHEYAWKHVKRPLVWRRDSAGAGMYAAFKDRGAQSHLAKHLDTRDLFMAKDRLWTV